MCERAHPRPPRVRVTASIFPTSFNTSSCPCVVSRFSFTRDWRTSAVRSCAPTKKTKSEENRKKDKKKREERKKRACERDRE